MEFIDSINEFKGHESKLTFIDLICPAISGMLDLSRRAIKIDSLLYNLME